MLGRGVEYFGSGKIEFRLIQVTRGLHDPRIPVLADCLRILTHSNSMGSGHINWRIPRHWDISGIAVYDSLLPLPLIFWYQDIASEDMYIGSLFARSKWSRCQFALHFYLYLGWNCFFSFSLSKQIQSRQTFV